MPAANDTRRSLGKPLERFLLSLLLCLPIAAAAEAVPQWTANDEQLVLSGVPDIPRELVSRLNRYQNVRSATFLEWAEDGESLFIRTRFDEVSQLFRVREPGGYREQLTWFPEPVGQVERKGDTRLLSITMDEGGGEQDQIFLFDPKNGETRRLSDGVSRNRMARWSRDGRRMAFQSTRRNGRSNDLWWMEPGRPGSEELLLEAPDGTWFGPADFSHDGRWLLRIEDIDPPREQPGAADRIVTALAAFGFEWDGPVLYQSDSHADHVEALNGATVVMSSHGHGRSAAVLGSNCITPMAPAALFLL